MKKRGKCEKRLRMQNAHKAHSSDPSKGRNKSFKNANGMPGQLLFVGHNFFSILTGYAKGRQYPIDIPQ